MSSREGRLEYPAIVEPYVEIEMGFDWWRGEQCVVTTMSLSRAEWHSRMSHRHDNPLRDE